MEILQVLLSLFLNSEYGKNFKPILELLQENSFDLAKLVKNLDANKIEPIIKLFMQERNKKSAKENPTEFSAGCDFYLNPIVNVADKEIVYSLNKYFAID